MKDPKTRRNLLILTAILTSMTLAVALYIFDNIFIIMESASAWSYKPIKKGFNPKTRVSDISYGAREEERLDIYRTEVKLAPVLLFLGSGFGQGTRKHNYRHIGMFGQREGFIVVIPSWSHAPGMISSMISQLEPYQTISGQAKSTSQVFKWIQKNISKYGGNPKQIHVLTHGSGLAILARAISINQKMNKQISSIAGFNSIIDLGKMPESHRRSLDKESAKILKDFSPNGFDGIPLWLAISANDIPNVKKNGENFLKAKKIKKLIIFDRETHRSAIFRLGRYHHSTTNGLKNFWSQFF